MDKLDSDQLSRALDQLLDELQPATGPETAARPRRGLALRGPGEDAAVPQIAEHEDVLQVQEAEPHVARRGGLRAATPTEVKYERRLARLERSQIGTWLESIDRRLTPNRGLREMGAEDFGPLSKPLRSGRILLLIHGTFSESECFLNGLAQNRGRERFLDWARGHYSHILTFNHPTLSVNPVLNARALGLLLADCDAEIDVICHSRGDLVTRWWLEVFDRAPPDKRRAVFVGAPLAGTGLAAPGNLRGSLSLLANIGTTLGAASAGIPFLTVLTGVFAVVTSVTKLAAQTPAIDAAVALVPGLSAQSRVGNNRELLSLRQPPGAVAGRYFAVKANFESEQPGWNSWRYFRRIRDRTKDALADLVFEGDNDLVVDTGSMVDLSDEVHIPAEQVLDFGTNDRIHHTSYFAQPEIVEFIRQALGHGRAGS